MKNITRVPVEEKKYFVECFRCGHYMDQRNLSEVLHHESGLCLNGKKLRWSGESEEESMQPLEYSSSFLPISPPAGY
jgi:hypothetical protein